MTALETYGTQSVEQRLANRLLMIAVNFGMATPQGITLELYLPQEMLAPLMRTARQRVNQVQPMAKISPPSRPQASEEEAQHADRKQIYGHRIALVCIGTLPTESRAINAPFRSLGVTKVCQV
jgi:hypothetical protein